MSLQTSAEVLSLQAFRWFALNGMFANLANGINYIAMSWVVLNSSTPISALAILMMCFWGPTVFLGPLCGVIAERFSKKWVLIFSNTSRGILLILVIAIPNSNLSSFTIYCLAAALSILGNLYGPAAFSYIRQVVPQEKLLHANTIMAMAYELGNVVGMGCAGFLMALHSAEFTLFASGFLFLTASLCLLIMKKPQLAISAEIRSHFWKDLKEGIYYLVHNKKLLITFGVQVLLMVNLLTAPILLAPFAKHLLHTTVGQFGSIQAALSIGIILGGLLAPIFIDIWSLKQVLLSKTAALILLFILFSLTQHFYSAIVIYFFIGVSITAWTLAVTRLQMLTDLGYQARVQASSNSMAAVAILSVYILLNFTGDLVSVRVLYGFEALISSLAFFLVWRHRAMFST